MIVEWWLLGRLRRRIFHTFADVDAALSDLIEQLNERQALRRLGVTRRQLLKEVDRPALGVARRAYEYRKWRVPRVGLDCYVEIDATIIQSPTASPAEVEARRAKQLFQRPAKAWTPHARDGKLFDDRILRMARAGLEARALTIYNVARPAGVSHQAVSRLLGGFEGIGPENRAKVEMSRTRLPAELRRQWVSRTKSAR